MMLNKVYIDLLYKVDLARNLNKSYNILKDVIKRATEYILWEFRRDFFT